MAGLYKCDKDIISIDIEEIANTLLEAMENRVQDLEDGLSTEAIVRAEADQILEDKKADKTEIYTRIKLNSLIPRLAFEQAMILLGYTGGYFEVLYEGYENYKTNGYYTAAGREALAKKTVYFDIDDDGTINERSEPSGSTEEIFLINDKPVGFRIMNEDSITKATNVILCDKNGISILQRSSVNDDFTSTTAVNINSNNKTKNGYLQLLNGGVINWGVIKSSEASKDGSRVTGGGIIQIDLDNGDIYSDKTDVIHLKDGTNISIYKDARNSTSGTDGTAKVNIVDGDNGYASMSKEYDGKTFEASVTKDSLAVTSKVTNATTSEKIASIKKNLFITGEWYFEQDPDTGILSIYREKNS